MRTQTVTFEYDPGRNILFTVDDYEVMCPEDADKFFALYQQQLAQIGKKVHLVTNIDRLYIAPHMEEHYGEVARKVSREWILKFARYGDMAISRVGIAIAAQKADFVTSVHKTREEAVAAVLAAGDGGRG